MASVGLDCTLCLARRALHCGPAPPRLKLHVLADFAVRYAMSTPALLVCERRGDWAFALRRAFAQLPAGERPRIVETRSVAECRERWSSSDDVGAASAALVVEWIPAAAEQICELLIAHCRSLPTGVRIVVAAPPADAPERSACESLLREAGATEVVDSPRRVAAAVDLVRRRLAARPQASPIEPKSIADRVRASLPWRPVAPEPPPTT